MRHTIVILLIFILGCGIPEIQNPADFKVRGQDPNKISIVLILDNSASMADRIDDVSKMDLAKASLQQMLDLLDNGDMGKKRIEVSVFIFTDFGSPVMLQRLCEFDHRFLSSMLRDIPISKDAPLGSALADAQLELDAHAEGRRYIIMLTDGEKASGSDPDKVLRSIGMFNRLHGNHPAYVLVIAFGTDPKAFAAMEQHGAHVFGANDGKALTDVIVAETRKILELPE